MTTIAFPITSPGIVQERVASVVREGLTARSKRLPSWLFYDEAGSRLFEEITERPEYYLTRTERRIFADHAEEMIARAVGSDEFDLNGIGCERLRIVELGAGSADKTRLLLQAAIARQGTVTYEPVDVSASALEGARERIEQELPEVTVVPRVEDYCHQFEIESAPGERRLVLYIGSSIGNFEPREAEQLLERVRAGLRPGDGLLLGVDLAKDEATLLAAYDDAAGVTADFNLNLLARLNRELDAEFELDAFEHRAVWNGTESRMEMHLESRTAQRVRVNGLDMEVEFGVGERIHTENSYKYAPGQAEGLLNSAGFEPVESWTDEKRWFRVCLGRAE
ncbi:MAG: L-histidine N(alpha)-methyltransferase [Terracidiphilus sp.]|jgi:dimethylhistidine N-methyltransferase